MFGTQFENMPEPFLNAARLEDFWGYVIWFLKYNMPMIMIVLAVIIAGMMLEVIVSTFAKGDKSRDDDDDDIEVKHY